MIKCKFVIVDHISINFRALLSWRELQAIHHSHYTWAYHWDWCSYLIACSVHPHTCNCIIYLCFSSFSFFQFPLFTFLTPQWKLIFPRPTLVNNSDNHPHSSCLLFLLTFQRELHVGEKFSVGRFWLDSMDAMKNTLIFS